MRVVVCRAGGAPTAEDVPDDLPSLVGGSPSGVRLPDGLRMWVNDDFISLGLPPNEWASQFYLGGGICGDVVIARLRGDGSNAGLTPEDVEALLALPTGDA